MGEVRKDLFTLFHDHLLKGGEEEEGEGEKEEKKDGGLEGKKEGGDGGKKTKLLLL